MHTYTHTRTHTQEHAREQKEKNGRLFNKNETLSEL